MLHQNSTKFQRLSVLRDGKFNITAAKLFKTELSDIIIIKMIL